MSIFRFLPAGDGKGKVVIEGREPIASQIQPWQRGLLLRGCRPSLPETRGGRRHESVAPRPVNISAARAALSPCGAGRLCPPPAWGRPASQEPGLLSIPVAARQGACLD
jgi:hypothetical protein